MGVPSTLPEALSALRACQQRYARLVEVKAKQMPGWLLTEQIEAHHALVELCAMLVHHYGDQDVFYQFKAITGDDPEDFLE